MKLKPFVAAIFMACFSIAFSQENLSVGSISPDLFINANAVLRYEEIKIEIEAVDKMTVHTKRTVTILNDKGNSHSSAWEGYDKEIKIKNLSAIIYDASGKEIKKIKQKDFKDRSYVSSNDLYTDTRLQYLEYLPQKYPYTITFESEVQSPSTVFISPWIPVSGYNLSIEKASYTMVNTAQIPFRFQEKNMDSLQIEKNTVGQNLHYSLKNIPAYTYEDLSPELSNLAPQLRISLNEFNLVGVKGTAADWKEFGKWQYKNLLEGRNILPQATIQRVKELTAGAGSDVEKARIIYQYVQDNTRYISVQLGIGGWEPMLAESVDKLGYGDCKALTNYTKALLEVHNIPSNYAVLYAGENQRSIDKDFTSMQGNHVFLNIPQEGDDIWLECTSQTNPFNYISDFQDNRDVLLIKPDGGEIVRTKSYSFDENLQKTYSRITLDAEGSFQAEGNRSSKGIAYGNIYTITREKETDKVLFYKRRWGHLQNLDVQKMNFENNRNDGEFIENFILTGQKYATKAGKRFLIPVNFFQTETYNLERYSERKYPFEIKRGSSYEDTFEFVLPAGFEIESIPETAFIDNEFGKFELQVQILEEEGSKLLKVDRSYVVKDGLWEAGSYSDFREFMNTINSFINQKAVIVSVN